jgi:hypothetical protein
MSEEFSILERPPAGDQLDYENDQRDDEQEVNEPAEHMKTEITEQPKHKQNDENSPKHRTSFLLSYFAQQRESALT